MKYKISIAQLACVSLGLSLGALPLVAQQPAVAPAPPTSTSSQADQIPDPVLKVSPEKALEAFEPPLNEEYTLGAGDQISLDFPNRPELTTAGKATVIGPDGRITLPLAGPIPIANLTREAAAKAIEDALSPYYTNLTVTVTIDKYSSNRVRVLGYVQHPGEIPFEGTPTLLDAIGRAGLLATATTVSKDGTVTSTGSGIPETCTIYRGNDQEVQVQLRTLLTSGNALADMRLRRNDVVYVPEPKQLFVSVLGQVGKPGTVVLTPQSTLTSVLAEAGCCSDNGGYNPKIHILQPSTGKDTIVEYKKLMTLAGQQEYTLHSGDVILVPVSGFNKVANIFTKISPVATLVSIAAVTGVF